MVWPVGELQLFYNVTTSSLLKKRVGRGLKQRKKGEKEREEERRREKREKGREIYQFLH